MKVSELREFLVNIPGDAQVLFYDVAAKPVDADVIFIKAGYEGDGVSRPDAIYFSQYDECFRARYMATKVAAQKRPSKKSTVKTKGNVLTFPRCRK
jgi:hypothetical protein